jgi:ABC-type dipeptide/oligopeptide/nickel transport system permease subunit
MAFSTPASDTSLPTPGGAALTVPRAEVRGSSLWRDAWRRLLRNKLAVVGGVVVILLCLLAVFADLIAPQSYTKPNFGRLYEAPSREFPLGTDQLGRDVLSRLIYGARVSMLVGLGAQVIVVLIGVPIGALSGFIGGRTDLLLTRFVDVMYAFPRLLFVILVMSMLGAGLMNIFTRSASPGGWASRARRARRSSPSRRRSSWRAPAPSGPASGG